MELLPAPQTPSGILPVDRAWGGLYRGGSYLAFGPSNEARSRAVIRFLQAGVRAGESSLLISAEQPATLLNRSAELDFDLKAAHRKGLVRMLRVPGIDELETLSDARRARALAEIVAIARHEQPGRLAFDAFTPFTRFASLDRFRLTFLQMLTQISAMGTTLLLLMEEGEDARDRHRLSFVREHLTGALRLEQDTAQMTRRVTLLPNARHGQQKEMAPYSLDMPAMVPPKLMEGASTVPPAEDDVPFHLAPHAGDGASKRPVRELVLAPATDRKAFCNRLQDHFFQRDLHGTPFLLIAMRADGDGEDLPLLFDHVRASLHSQDDAMADFMRARLVVLLAGSRPDAAQHFFSRLRDRLFDQCPDKAKDLLHSVSTIFVPDGRGFLCADDFVRYALGAS